jgi:hypothetical protein
LIVVVGLTLTGVPVVSADEQVVGNPDIEVSVQDNRINSNERTQLTVQVTNDGEIEQGGLARFEERVQTARNLRLEIDESEIDAPIEVKSGPALVGTLRQRGTQARFDIEVGDAEPGQYRVPIELEYSFTRIASYDPGGANPEYDDFTRTETRFVTIVVESRPEFELATDRTRNLFAGDTGQLDITVENTGTQTATDATATLTSQTEGLYFGSPENRSPSTRVFISDLTPGERRDISVKVGASDELSRGAYPVGVQVDYENENGVIERSDSVTAGVVVGPERRFALRNVTTENLQVGQSGATVTAELVNVGEAPASDAVLRLASQGAVTATAPESAVGTMEPGESRRVRFVVSVSPEAEPGSRVLTFVPEFENADAEVRTADTIRQSVLVSRGISFTVENIETDGLRVSEANVNVTGQVRNTGNTTARNAVVRLSSGTAVQITGAESAVGDLSPGETRPVNFRVAVPEDAEPGTRSLTFGVEYENQNGDLKQNLSPIRRPVEVGPERDQFVVENINTSLTAGGSSEVIVTVQNNGDTPVGDTTMRLFVNDPLSSSDNSAFLGTIEPGERKQATFQLSAGGSAISKEYQGAVEVRYEDRTGDSQLADGISVGIPVAESSGGLPLPFIGLGIGMVLLGGGLFIYRRRRGGF